MEQVNNWKKLVEILGELDIRENIIVKIGEVEIELLYDVENDKFSMVDKEKVEFKDLDEMETYIQWYYLM